MIAVSRVVLLVAAAFVLASVVPTASAAQGGGLGLANGVCRDDVNRLCADAKGNRGAVPACLRSKLAELDSDCRQELEDRDARLAERNAVADAACPTELQKFCADQPDYEKIPCLRRRYSDLSPDCAAVVPAPKE